MMDNTHRKKLRNVIRAAQREGLDADGILQKTKTVAADADIPFDPLWAQGEINQMVKMTPKPEPTTRMNTTDEKKLRQLWNVAVGLFKAKQHPRDINDRLIKAKKQLGLDDIVILDFMDNVKDSLKTGRPFEFYNSSEPEPPTPVINTEDEPETVEEVPQSPIKDETPPDTPIPVSEKKPKRITTQSKNAAMMKALILTYMEINFNTDFSVRNIKRIFSTELSDRTIKRYLEELREEKKLIRKNEYQRFGKDRVTLRHIYKSCPATESKE